MMYSADVQSCVGGSLVEIVHLGRSQEKAVVPDSTGFTPRSERKSLNAQATWRMRSLMWALKEEDRAFLTYRSADV